MAQPPHMDREIDEFASIVVREYLRKRGMQRTLECFDAEIAKDLEKGQKDEDANTGAVSTWYRFSRAVGLARLRRTVFAMDLKSTPGHVQEGDGELDVDSVVDDGRNRREGPADIASTKNTAAAAQDSLLRTFIRYLCATRDAEAADPNDGLANAPEAVAQEPVINAKEDRSSHVRQSTAPVGQSADARASFGAELGPRQTSGPWQSAASPIQIAADDASDGEHVALLDEVLAMNELEQGSALYAAALETPLNERRFHRVTGDLTQAPAMERSGEPAARDPKGREMPKSTTVEELTRQLDSMANAERRAAKLRQKQQRRRQSIRKLLQPSQHNPSAKQLPTSRHAQGLEDSQASFQPSSSLTLSGSKSSSALARSQHLDRRWAAQQRLMHRHREHPATYAVTFKIMDRDLKVGVANATQHVRITKDLDRSRQRISNEEMLLLQEKYAGKRQRRCALCEKSFNVLNLPMAISYKAIMDLRDSWGVHVRPDVKRSRAPRCYDEVNVCLLCSQLFSDGTNYRAPKKQEDDADTQLVAFHKSIEHLDPRHESAFFRP